MDGSFFMKPLWNGEIKPSMRGASRSMRILVIILATT
jgi:hypothetical protein